MPNSKEALEWQEFKARLERDMDKQVTSNKALLWVGIAVNGIFTFIALTVAIVALIHSLMLGRDNMALQKELLEYKNNIEALDYKCEEAKRAYGNARSYISRRNKVTHTQEENE